MVLQQSEAPTRTVDPITAEIVRSALVAITDEMKTNLMRTAYNMIIYEALDFTVGLFDADGNTVSSASGSPCSSAGSPTPSRPSSPTTARPTSCPATSCSPTTPTSW